jgi:glycosyltransferase involved in cell wall biosynthesis
MASGQPLRICLVYDCLYPHTVGGAERWYRNLAERLIAEGHEVTYLTLRQWERGGDPGLPGVRVRAVGPRMRLYARPGRRRILPALLFGLGVLAHLLRHGRRYDVVHTASFPYFSLLAAAGVRWTPGSGARYRLVVDWHEVWTRAYWREYLGWLRGTAGWIVQRACLRVAHEPFCFSRLHAERLRAAGVQGVRQLEGEYAGPLEPSASRGEMEPLVVYAGRHIPEKQVARLVPAIARACEQIPGLRGRILGDGPDRTEVMRLILEHGLREVVEAPGFVSPTEVEDALSRAMCLVLPSRREGYGLVVVEAAAHGTPAVVVAGADNASVELIEDGVNGIIARSVSPEDLAAAIVRVAEAGPVLRASTEAWFRRNARRLSLDGSLQQAVAAYAPEQLSGRR